MLASCGLNHARGKYYICIDSDTIYPKKYIETLVKTLEKPDTVAVSSLWSYIPDKQHPWLAVKSTNFYAISIYSYNLSNVRNSV